MPIQSFKAGAPRRKGAPTVARQGKHQLVDTIAEEVSTVDRPAIAEPFYLVKAAPPFGGKKDPKKDKKKPGMEKADPPAAGAPAPEEPEAEAGASTMTNAELLQGLGAYMEGLIAIANEVEGQGQLEGPVAAETMGAIQEAVSQFVDALGLSQAPEEPEAEATEEVAASAPETKEAAVANTNGVAKRSFKLTGDKATRFEVAMEILGGLNILPAGDDEVEGAATEEVAAAPAPAKGKAPAAAPAKAPAKPVVAAAKKSEGGEEVPGWARALAGAVHAIGKEVKAMKAGSSKPSASKGVEKSFGVSNAAPVDGHEEQGNQDNGAWPRDMAGPRRR